MMYGMKTNCMIDNFAPHDLMITARMNIARMMLLALMLTARMK